ncbi:MAG: helix-turn-helix transcriptional regulator [Ruminococcus sp.]|jgi:transcriptional regulator with XRE-family HTH domain|nr:helix-turn-helix transcriptional regulator [Ruminococcus sp.]MCI9330307.1 helix-turn-helix transcriptional regulator [Ruminococcus sp.]
MEQKLKQDIQIGSRIRKLRMERNMTQEQVVIKLQLQNLDITRSIYSQIEGGRYSIRISVLAGLAKIFHVDFNAFFEDLKISI